MHANFLFCSERFAQCNTRDVLRRSEFALTHSCNPIIELCLPNSREILIYRKIFREMSPSTRVLVFNFWEIMAFLANSLVFLLIGLQIDLLALFANWQFITWAIIAVLGARAVSVFGLSWIGRGIPRRYKNVLYWGGLRGAISLALAISLPASLGPIRRDIQAMAFGVVLFTLLFQGLTSL